jgi:hypothetical protein
MSTVTPIRPGLQWSPSVLYMHTLPPGVSLLELDDWRGDEHGAQLGFDVSGTADALVNGGFVTHDMLAAIGKSGTKRIRTGDTSATIKRRKHGYVVSIWLYDKDSPNIARYAAMFSLDRKVKTRDKRAYLPERALQIAELWFKLRNDDRAIVEAHIRKLATEAKPS